MPEKEKKPEDEIQSTFSAAEDMDELVEDGVMEHVYNANDKTSE